MVIYFINVVDDSRVDVAGINPGVASVVTIGVGMESVRCREKREVVDT